MEPRVEQTPSHPILPTNQLPVALELPSETELTLLCLDYLRDITRTYAHYQHTHERADGGNTTTTGQPSLLQQAEGLDPNYITMACWALNRAFVKPRHLQHSGRQNNDNVTTEGILSTDEDEEKTTGTDAFYSAASFDDTIALSGPIALSSRMARKGTRNKGGKGSSLHQYSFPSLEEMEQELLHPQDRSIARAGIRGSIGRTYRNGTGGMDHDHGDQKKEDDDEVARNSNDYIDEQYYEDKYEYDDEHASNSHRFYLLGGLASGTCTTLPAANQNGAAEDAVIRSTCTTRPLTLGEIATVGLHGLGARSRLEAEKDMIQSELFEQFVQAVSEKGFFEKLLDEDMDEETRRNQEKLYEDRYRKVVAKFRTKLASKAITTEATNACGRRFPPSMTDSSAMNSDAWIVMGMTASEQQRERRLRRMEEVLDSRFDPSLQENADLAKSPSSLAEGPEGTPPTPLSYVRQFEESPQRIFFGGERLSSSVHSPAAENPLDLEAAEKLKNEGNTHMQKKRFEEARLCYTQALKLSPSGPQSHVYFSNRAAALVSMKKFREAIVDSERSLALKPDYGKAHARLGLAHFLLGNYRQAMEAYAVALKYEPNNKSSKDYLEKAALRLAESEENNLHGAKNRSQPDITMSYSVVSQLEQKSRRNASETFAKTLTSNEREAENCKLRGNAFMSNRDYEQARGMYARAIQLSPNGPQSHVFYSNRAAALCYLELYKDAEKDSLKALSLDPSYGKAHARLGLSRFFLEDYAGAVAAYTAALRYDPDNAASKSYLAKARNKLREERGKSAHLTAHKLMQDAELRSLATKVMASSSEGAGSVDLVNDPDMQRLAKTVLQKEPAIMNAMIRK